MAAVTFGTSTPSAVQSSRLEPFEFSIRQPLVASGVYDVSVISPTSGIIDYLVAIGATNPKDFVYSHSEFGEKVGKDQDLPGISSVKSFLMGAIAMKIFVWDETDPVILNVHQQRIMGRFLMVVHHCM